MKVKQVKDIHIVKQVSSKLIMVKGGYTKLVKDYSIFLLYESYAGGFYIPSHIVGKLIEITEAEARKLLNK